MAKRPIDLTTFVKHALRRASYRWGPRSEVFKAARVSRGVYQCAKCANHVGRKLIKMDHIAPVVDPKRGWQGWDEYVLRMFPPVNGFQALCKDCHSVKTKKENEVRRSVKKKRKRK